MFFGAYTACLHRLSSQVTAGENLPLLLNKAKTRPRGEPTPMTGQDQSIDPSKPAVTTYQEDLTTSGQRRINLIWEFTQAAIAIMVVLATVIVASVQAIFPTANQEFPVILTSLVMLVIGFYFSRTNHAAIGGMGSKPNDEYKGR